MHSKNPALEFIDVDFEEFVRKIETSFDLTFGKMDFAEVNSVGDFIDVVNAKLEFEITNRCTTQSVFYKIRRSTKHLLDKEVTPDSILMDVFPKSKRYEFWKRLEKEMDVRLPCLRAPRWLIALVYAPLGISIFISFLLIFVKLILGLSLFTTIIVTLRYINLAAEKYLNHYPEIHFRTLVKEIVSTNYAKVVNGKGNKVEVENIIKEMFIDFSAIDENKYNREVLISR